MKFIVMLLIALSFFTVADAAKIDIYRTAVQNKTFTLKYKITEFPVRISNRESKMNLISFQSHIYSTDTGHFSSDEVNTGGIIVLDGKNSYIENFHDAYKIDSDYRGTRYVQNIYEGGICTLTKDGEIFKFLWKTEDGAKKYYGSKGLFGVKSEKVKAISEEENQTEVDKYAKYVNPYDVLYNDYNFGNADLAAALAAVLPADRIIATPTTPVYKFVGSGTLNGGLNYEDFSAEKNNTFYAIRYYFNGDKMVKIAMFNYTKNGGTITGYEKHVLDIEEFSTEPDENYLQLPNGLKDTTKRKDGGKK